MVSFAVVFLSCEKTALHNRRGEKRKWRDQSTSPDLRKAWLVNRLKKRGEEVTQSKQAKLSIHLDANNNKKPPLDPPTEEGRKNKTKSKMSPQFASESRSKIGEEEVQ